MKKIRLLAYGLMLLMAVFTFAACGSGGGGGGAAAKVVFGINGDQLIVYEGNPTSSYISVWLSTQPTDTVTVNVVAGDSSEVSVDKESLVFDSTNWDLAQEVRVTGVDDFVVDGEMASYVILDINYKGTTDERFQGFNGSVNVVTTDNDIADVPSLYISAGVLDDFGENDSPNKWIDVAPRTQPALGEEVVVIITSGDETEVTVSPATLTFTNASWTEKTVTVLGVDDDIVDGTQKFDITLSTSTSTDADYAVLDDCIIKVTYTDDDGVILPAIDVSKASVTVSEDLTTDTFTVAPATQPGSGLSVVVTVTSGDEGEATVSPATLTFTNSDWTAKTVTVTGVNDDPEDGDQVFDITLDMSTSTEAGYAVLADKTVSVTNQDNDAPAGTPGITVSKTSVSVSEDETTDTFTVVPDTQPAAGQNVVVTVTSDDEGEATVSPATLTFTNSDWTAKTVTVTGVDDSPVFDLDQTFSLVLNTSTSTDTDYTDFEKTVDVTNLSVDVTEGSSTQPLDLTDSMPYTGSVDAMTMSFYVFPVTSGTKYEIRLTGHTQSAWLDAYNSDSTYSDVACSASGASNATSCQVVADGDLMYVRISGWSVTTSTGFSLSAKVPTTYYIKTFSNGASLAATDTYLRLYDFNGATEMANNDNASALYSEIVYGLVSGQTYYVKVDDWLFKGGGYSIRISDADTFVNTAVSPPSPDGYEDDDSSVSATTLVLYAAQHHTFDGIGDDDWFTFTAP